MDNPRIYSRTTRRIVTIVVLIIVLAIFYTAFYVQFFNKSKYHAHLWSTVNFELCQLIASVEVICNEQCPCEVPGKTVEFKQWMKNSLNMKDDVISDTFLRGPHPLTDRIGNPIQIILSEDNILYIASSGLNGEWESMQGDDIVESIRLNDCNNQ